MKTRLVSCWKICNWEREEPTRGWETHTAIMWKLLRDINIIAWIRGNMLGDSLDKKRAVMTGKQPRFIIFDVGDCHGKFCFWMNTLLWEQDSCWYLLRASICDPLYLFCVKRCCFRAWNEDSWRLCLWELLCCKPPYPEQWLRTAGQMAISWLLGFPKTSLAHIILQNRIWMP